MYRNFEIAPNIWQYNMISPPCQNASYRPGGSFTCTGANLGNGR